MPAWLLQILIPLLTKFGAWVYNQVLKKVEGKADHTAADANVDARLAVFKNAYKESFNGEPVTPEQRKKLNAAISDFIRGGPNGGL